LFILQGALSVAMLNIEIPHLLGSVINVVAKFARNGGSTLFREQVKLPVFRLVFMYVAQVRAVNLCLFKRLDVVEAPLRV
jgi:ATP-binding cassette subfamily B (MDR/TAP) protein 8